MMPLFDGCNVMSGVNTGNINFSLALILFLEEKISSLRSMCFIVSNLSATISSYENFYFRCSAAIPSFCSSSGIHQMQES